MEVFSVDGGYEGLVELPDDLVGEDISLMLRLPDFLAELFPLARRGLQEFDKQDAGMGNVLSDPVKNFKKIDLFGKEFHIGLQFRISKYSTPGRMSNKNGTVDFKLTMCLHHCLVLMKKITSEGGRIGSTILGKMKFVACREVSTSRAAPNSFPGAGRASSKKNRYDKNGGKTIWRASPQIGVTASGYFQR